LLDPIVSKQEAESLIPLINPSYGKVSSGKKEDEYTLSDEAEQILEIEMVIMTVDEFLKELERDF
jgi:hypothetical protein